MTALMAYTPAALCAAGIILILIDEWRQVR